MSKISFAKLVKTVSSQKSEGEEFLLTVLTFKTTVLYNYEKYNLLLLNFERIQPTFQLLRQALIIFLWTG